MPTGHREHLQHADVVAFYARQHATLTQAVGRAQARLLEQHLTTAGRRRDLFSLLRRMDDVVDRSDPDFAGAQLFHCVQTAESLRALVAQNPALPEWLPLVGLLHDLGKVAPKLAPALDPEPISGGDIWPLGVDPGPDVVLRSEGFLANPDFADGPRQAQPGCGFGSMTWWGHDEAMYQILLRSKTALPPEALYIVRFHSFYAWHEKRNYMQYASPTDLHMLGWLRLFQLSDLYSKHDDPVVEPKLDMAYYGDLEKTYLPNGIWM